MSEWYDMAGCGRSATGATLSLFNSKGYLIGGTPTAVPIKKTKKEKAPAGPAANAGISQVMPSPWLQVDHINLPEMKWSPVIVNSGGLLNRAYHAAAGIGALDNRIFVFGGIYSSASDEIATDVLTIETSSIFGVQASLLESASHHPCTAKRGLSANIVGNNASTKQVVLFGGSKNAQNAGECSDEMWLMNPDMAINGSADASTDSAVYMQLQAGADSGGLCPCPRAFHSCTTAGRDGNILLVYGGQDDDGNILNDLWMCDVSAVTASIARNYEIKQKRKLQEATKEARALERGARESKEGEEDEDGGEEGGEEEEEEQEQEEPQCCDVVWTCLLESTAVGPRYLHTSYSYMTPQVEGAEADDNIYLCVMGGISPSGYASNTEVHTACINLAANLVSEEEGEEGDEPVQGPAVEGGDFTKNSVSVTSKCPNLTGIACATLTTPEVPCAVVVCVNGNAGSLLVTDDTVALALATKKHRIAKIKELKAAAAAAAKAANPDTQMAEEEDTTKLPSKVSYSNGDVYEGELKLPPGFNEGDPIVPLNLIRSGKGRMSYKATGENFEGLWNENVRSGFGKSEVTDSSGRRTRYEGQYVNDVKCGDGTLSYTQSTGTVNASNVASQSAAGTAAPSAGLSQPQSSILVGPEDSLLDEIANNVIYTGMWADDCYAGKGELRYSNGDTYVGLFKDGKRHGKGTLTPFAAPADANGNIDSSSSVISATVSPRAGNAAASAAVTPYFYKGEWENDAIAGIGEVKLFTIPTSEHSKTLGTYEGNTKNGIPWGVGGYCAYKDGSEYLGEWKQGKKNGVGVYIYANLDRYEGKFVGNMRCGQGKLSCKNGDVHEGLWDNDRPNGYGRRSSITKDGTKIEEGHWENGEFKG